MKPPNRHDLDRRLAEIDRLPLSFEGRLLARLAARVNAADVLPWWMTEAECARLGDALVSACHAARVPVSRVRRLVDPEAEDFERRAIRVMRSRD